MSTVGNLQLSVQKFQLYDPSL